MATFTLKCILVSVLVVSSTALPPPVIAPSASPVLATGKVTGPTASHVSTVSPVVVASQVSTATAVNATAPASMDKASQVTITSTTAVPSLGGNSSVPSTTRRNLDEEENRNSSSSTQKDIIVIRDNIIRTRNGTTAAINNLMNQKKQFSLAISSGACNSGQNLIAVMINKSIKSVLSQMITYQQNKLANIKISELPEYSETFSTQSNLSSFKMKNITLKGLDGITVSKLEFDICAMTFESEVTVPSLVLTADYTLDGFVDLSPIKGAGNLSVTVDTLYVYDQSFMDCGTVLFSEDVCRFSGKNKTVDINMNSVVVKINGVTYKNLTNVQINEGINFFVTDYIKSNKLGLVQKITDLMVRYKKQTMDGLSPMQLLKNVRGYLSNLLLELYDPSEMLQKDNFFQNLFTLFI